MRLMKRDNLGLRVMLENEDEEKEARESNLGLRLMKKSDSLGMRLMKKDSLGMRLMKKNSNDQAKETNCASKDFDNENLHKECRVCCVRQSRTRSNLLNRNAP